MFVDIMTNGPFDKLLSFEIYKNHKIFLKNADTGNQEIVDGYVEVLKDDHDSDYYLDDANEGYSCDINPEVSYIGSLAIDGQPQEGKFIGVTSLDFNFAENKKEFCLETCHDLVDYLNNQRYL